MNMYLVVEQQVLGQRQERQLNGRGKTAGVGHPFGANDIFPVQLGQPVYEVVPRSVEPVVGRQVDDAQLFGKGMTLHEFAGVTVCRTEEKQVDFVERHLVGKPQVGLAEQSRVDIGYFVACVALAMDKHDFHVGVVDQ